MDNGGDNREDNESIAERLEDAKKIVQDDANREIVKLGISEPRTNEDALEMSQMPQEDIELDRSEDNSDEIILVPLAEDLIENSNAVSKNKQKYKRRLIDNSKDLNRTSKAQTGSCNKKARKSFKQPNSNVSMPQNAVKLLEFNPRVEYPRDERMKDLPDCTCLNVPLQLSKELEEKENTYCQALDSLEDKLIGCCNTVARRQLVRSAVKTPFLQLCEVHLWRLRHHHCCPGCGVFCTQGTFYKCCPDSENKNQFHLFHCKCTVEGRCLHCNSEGDICTVRLELNMPEAPVFHMSQKPPISAHKARIAMGNNSQMAKAPTLSLKIPETDAAFSSAGLPVGQDRKRLEQVLESFRNLSRDLSEDVLQGDLYPAALTGNFEKIIRLLSSGCDPNYKYEEHDNETALHAAAKEGQMIAIHLLLQAGASMDPFNGKLYTPLMQSVENGHVEAVRYLIQVGAHLGARGEDGLTTLHLAGRRGSEEICRMLLDSGKLNVNVQDDGGWTPLVWASEHRHLDVIRLLLSRGVNPGVQDKEGNTALHWACYSGSMDVCHLLLDHGYALDVGNVHGNTPLHIAAQQDHAQVAVLLLDKGVDSLVLNTEGKTALMCCPDPTSDTWYSLKINQELKRFTSKMAVKMEKVLSTDISRGKEPYPIQCVNGVDEVPVPSDYLYITDSCETDAIAIDRTLTSLQSCQCQDNCTTSACTCATISFKCWFDKDRVLLPEFNMMDPPMIFECNQACLCWKNCHNRVVQNGITARLQLFRVANKGWGVRVLKDIPKGTFICEYVGEIITDLQANQREEDSYLFDLNNVCRDAREIYCLDARHYGNISRFINHLCEPNLVPVNMFVDHQDLRFNRIAIFSSRDIKAFEEIGFDYGERFWAIKYKILTCCCGSAVCKYSKSAIKETMASYNQRLQEEQNLEKACVQLA